MVNNTYTKVLVRLNPNKLIEDDYHVSYQFLEPKLVTGYDNGTMIGIPIILLCCQGVSFNFDDPEAFDLWFNGLKMAEGKPLYFFSKEELDVLVG